MLPLQEEVGPPINELCASPTQLFSSNKALAPAANILTQSYTQTFTGSGLDVMNPAQVEYFQATIANYSLFNGDSKTAFSTTVRVLDQKKRVQKQNSKRSAPHRRKLRTHDLTVDYAMTWAVYDTDIDYTYVVFILDGRQFEPRATCSCIAT